MQLLFICPLNRSSRLCLCCVPSGEWVLHQWAAAASCASLRSPRRPRGCPREYGASFCWFVVCLTPKKMSPSNSPSLSLPVYLHICLCQFVCFCPYLALCMCLSLAVSVLVYVSRCICLSHLSVFYCLSVTLHLCLSVSLADCRVSLLRNRRMYTRPSDLFFYLFIFTSQLLGKQTAISKHHSCRIPPSSPTGIVRSPKQQQQQKQRQQQAAAIASTITAAAATSAAAAATPQQQLRK